LGHFRATSRYGRRSWASSAAPCLDAAWQRGEGAFRRSSGRSQFHAANRKRAGRSIVRVADRARKRVPVGRPRQRSLRCCLLGQRPRSQLADAQRDKTAPGKTFVLCARVDIRIPTRSPRQRGRGAVAAGGELRSLQHSGSGRATKVVGKGNGFSHIGPDSAALVWSPNRRRSQS